MTCNFLISSEKFHPPLVAVPEETSAKRGRVVVVQYTECIVDVVLEDVVSDAVGKPFTHLTVSLGIGSDQKLASSYQIIVADAVSVNFSGRCKFLQI